MKEQRMNRILERIVEKRKQHRKRKKGKEKSDREELRRRDRDNVQIVLWGKRSRAYHMGCLDFCKISKRC